MNSQEREGYIRNRYPDAPKPFVEWFIRSGWTTSKFSVARDAWMAATLHAIGEVNKVPGSQLAAYNLREIA